MKLFNKLSDLSKQIKNKKNDSLKRVYVVLFDATSEDENGQRNESRDFVRTRLNLEDLISRFHAEETWMDSNVVMFNFTLKDEVEIADVLEGIKNLYVVNEDNKVDCSIGSDGMSVRFNF